MTKYDYLTQLKHHLQPLPLKERNAAMKYYEKYFNDAGPENERYVILNLGSPKQLAEKILHKNRHTLSGMVHETRKNVKNAQNRLDESQRKKSVFISVLCLPLVAVFVVLFILILAIFALCVAGLLVVAAAVGVILLCMSIPYAMTLTSVSLVVMGISLILISLPVLLFMPALNFVFFVCKKAVIGTFALFNRQFTGKVAPAK